MIDLASKLISEGRGSELMPREANPDAPITAYRSLSFLSTATALLFITSSDYESERADFTPFVHTWAMMICSVLI